MPPNIGEESGRAVYTVLPIAAPMRLTQGRNRVFGIFLALMVMWVIFHQVHPKRTIDRMRGLFAKMLSLEAKQLPPSLQTITQKIWSCATVCMRLQCRFALSQKLFPMNLIAMFN